mgnify:CR=1 FL=1
MNKLALSLLPASFKEKLRKRMGVPDMFFSLERMKQSGFSPRNIVDVGAYEGAWTRKCATLFPDADYLMVEAMPKKKEQLERVSREHRIKSQVAIAVLGSGDGQEVYFSELETASSVLEENETQHQRVLRKTRSLDRIVQEAGFNEIDLLKLDVQGYELEVLKGFGEHIKKTEVIISEISLIDIHKGVPLLRDVVNFMFDRGFVTYDICSVSIRRPLDGALWQTDFMFVKHDSVFRSKKGYA